MKKTLVLTLCLLASLYGKSYDFEVDGLRYTILSSDLENLTAEVAGYSSLPSDFVIPEEVTYQSNVFRVTSIGTSAFSNCSGLISISIPNSITAIGNHPFSGCSKLATIIVEEGNTVYDSRSNCNAIIKTATKELVAGCKETTIPYSVTTIGEYAFSGCPELSSILIPNSVKNIGSYAFENCAKLTSIIVEEGNTVYDSRDSCNAIIKKGANELIAGCKTTAIPKSVTAIGLGAFCHCEGLFSIDIPNSINSIGEYAFNGCSNLTSVFIPNSVKSIGGSAFINCPNLASVAVEEGNTVFDSRDSSNAIIKTATNELVVGCKNTIIPNSVTSIEEYAFHGCTGLTYISIPNSVTLIDQNSFYNCSGLTQIEIASSKIQIKTYTSYTHDVYIFEGCNSIEAVYIRSITLPELSRKPFTFTDQTFAVWNNIFTDNVYNHATLYVSEGVEAQCKASEHWSKFTHILAFSEGLETQYNTFLAEGEYPIGQDPGLYEENTVNAYNTAMQQAHNLIENGGTNIEYLNALKELNSTHATLLQAYISLSEGYYFIISGFDDFFNKFGVEKAAYINPNVPNLQYKTFDIEDVDFVFHITPNGNPDEYFVQSYVNGYYVAKGTAWYSSNPACTKEPEEPQNMRLYVPGKWYWGSRTYHNTSYTPYDSSEPKASNSQGNLTSWGQWNDDSTVQTHFNLWYLRKVSDEQMAGFAEKKAQSNRDAELLALVTDANELYKNLFAYDTDYSSKLITTVSGGADEAPTEDNQITFSTIRKQGVSFADKYSYLIDDNDTTYMQGSGYMSIKLKEPKQIITMVYNTRDASGHGSNENWQIWGNQERPKLVNLYGANTKAGDTIYGSALATNMDMGSLPLPATYTFDFGRPVNRIAYQVTMNANRGTYFTISEFQMYEANINETRSQYFSVGGMKDKADAMKSLAMSMATKAKNKISTDEDIAQLCALIDTVRSTHAITYILADTIFHADSYVLGASITPPEAPTEKGYTFSGWNEIPTTMGTEDITVTGNFIKNSTIGDVDNDGELNVGDLSRLVKMILDEYCTQDDTFKSADVNGDGELNVGDYSRLRKMILDAPVASSKAFQGAALSKGYRSAAVSLTSDDIALGAGQTKLLAVQLSNYDEEFNAVQFDIQLPKSLEIDSEATETAARTSGFGIATNGTRVILSNTRDQTISGSEGDILYLAVKADADIQLGSYEVEFDNVLLSTTESEVVRADSFYSTIMAEDLTGISSASSNFNPQSSKVYDLQGRKVNGKPQKGIYVINGKKVNIK